MRKFVFFLITCLFLNIGLMAQEKDEDYIRWSAEYERAKARANTWNKLEMVGGISAIISTALYFFDQKEKENINMHGFIEIEKTRKTGYLIGAAAGLAIGITSFILAVPARGRVRALEIEGKERGLLTASIYPLKGGIALSLKFSF